MFRQNPSLPPTTPQSSRARRLSKQRNQAQQGRPQHQHQHQHQQQQQQQQQHQPAAANGKECLAKALDEYEHAKAEHLAEVEQLGQRAREDRCSTAAGSSATNGGPDPKSWSEAKLERFLPPTEADADFADGSSLSAAEEEEEEKTSTKQVSPSKAKGSIISRVLRPVRRRGSTETQRDLSQGEETTTRIIAQDDRRPEDEATKRGRESESQNATPTATAIRAGGPCINDQFPNLRGATQISESFDLYEYLGDSWGVVFMHPADFTPVCTTELGQAAMLEAHFEARNVKLCGFSCSDSATHWDWIKDIYVATGGYVRFPIFADPTRENAAALGILDRSAVDDRDGLPVTVRAVYIIRPDKRVAMTMSYPTSIGRNFDEILRAVDALLLAEDQSVVTPANWDLGKDVIVSIDLKDAEAEEKFGKDKIRTMALPSEEGKALDKHYLRYLPDPSPSYDKMIAELSFM